MPKDWGNKLVEHPHPFGSAMGRPRDLFYEQFQLLFFDKENTMSKYIPFSLLGRLFSHIIPYFIKLATFVPVTISWTQASGSHRKSYPHHLTVQYPI